MDCSRHPGVEAAGVCVRCGSAACAECLRGEEGRGLCPACAGRAAPGGEPASAASPNAEAELPRAQPQDYLKATLLGFLAAWIVAVAWAKLIQLIGIRLGLAGLFLSMGVPMAMRIGAENRTGRAMPLISAALSVLAMILGYSYIEVDLAAKKGASANLPWLLQLPMGFAAFLSRNRFWDWIMIAFAGWQGWSVLRQRVAVQGVKERILQGLPDAIEFGQAYPDQFPALDRVTLEKWTEKLQDLGFEWSQDFRVANPPPSWPPGMARLFLHREQRCYAEIGQVFPAGKPPLVWCAVTSYLDGEWSLATSNLQFHDPSLIALRRPREVWSRHPGAEPEQLFHIHMDYRYRLASDFALGVPEVSVPAYQARQNHNLEARRELVRSMTDAQLITEHRQAQARPVFEWWGEWATATYGRAAAYPAAPVPAATDSPTAA